MINEIHCAPADKTVREEFVELHNAGLAAVDLSGWFFSDGIAFTFPEGTVIEPRTYLVVAQDPQALALLYPGTQALGPFAGRLDNDGELLRLRNALGGREDSVDFRRRFPWPIAGGSEGYSLELINPSLDNDLGASWRLSNPNLGESRELVPAGAVWRYLKGTAEASSPPDAWRARTFNDAAWPQGSASFGYGETFIRTALNDMRGGYTSVYLRVAFDVPDPTDVRALVLEAQYDDGFNAWINGVHVAGANVPSADMPYNGTASSALENLTFQRVALPDPAGYLVAGTNVLAVHFLNASLADSSDAFFDARLNVTAATGIGPTPGARNAVYAGNAPPLLRQVEHVPAEPVSGEPVLVTIKATDADTVASVTLMYQVVAPGAYVRITDAAYAADWTPVAMNDAGIDGDATAGDGIYSALLPGTLQRHRHLVRYRIAAEDAAGFAVTAPFPDDPQPNFAYFTYDGVPAWRGAVRPGVTAVRAFPIEVMRALPVYHLIAVEADVVNCQYNSGYENTHFFGTVVYEGIVHDHIEFEIRGEFSTYVSGKNKWRLHFNRGHEFQARDDFGRPYRTAWRTMNLIPASTPWVPTNRGMAALDEAIAFKLYALAGMPSSHTNFFQWRVIDEAVEADAASQYRGDLWGLYATLEHTDGRFLDERGLPDGNTYKIEGGAGDKRNQGPTQTVSSADYDALRNGYNVSQPIAWWRANVDLEGYYGFRTVDRAINNMDLREGWNICQYHDPATNRWSAMPWDLDMLYMPVTHWSGVMNFQNAILQHAELMTEYRNRSRELGDLLFEPGNFAEIIDELAAVENPPGWALTMVDVDESMWNYHPRTTSAHLGMFYRNPSTHTAIGGTITRTLVSADHEGMVRWIKDFVLTGYGAVQRAAEAADAAIPARPTATPSGPAEFPIDDLRFTASAFHDPNGDGTFGGMRWRLAEIAMPGTPAYIPGAPRPFEITAVWDSGELPAYAPEATIPWQVVEIGHRYRVRVRMKDSTGRWSQWSLPCEFTAGAPVTPFPQVSALRITEIMYHPAEDSDYEFIELMNTGPEALDLREVRFTDGIKFDFGRSAVTSLAPGEHVLVVGNAMIFGAAHDTTGMRIAGEFDKQLADEGERITLTYGAGATILDFTYDDAWYPETDGAGYSLVALDPWAPADAWTTAEGWRASAAIGGSPGAYDGALPTGGYQRPGDANQDGRLDISDAVGLLRFLFGSTGLPLPCEGTSIAEGGNLALLDVNGDGRADIADAVSMLGYLFAGGPAPAAGTNCIRIEGCPTSCRF